MKYSWHSQPSHTDLWRSPCGSEPARESAGSVSCVLADTTPSRAGSLPQEAGASRSALTWDNPRASSRVP
ncbi:hypothetical protein PspCFBP13508_03775 [Pseudomonas sp. CFBP13508]|uniref:Uncharacterized protein n=1 Tax=Pseudomonas atacamensis TaxID=2565368 RepID=A0AAQ2I2I4_9PSED|nr:hypothetical protein E1508_07710 [Pseudomonas moraviensis]THF34407.1 hypothetical protein E5170_09075 [Pseudomonas atacamensis]TKJ75177.1 hypothetical protein PspCFBP13508_03775 [Pseudomonas sp. CFBP13508]